MVMANQEKKKLGLEIRLVHDTIWRSADTVNGSENLSGVIKKKNNRRREKQDCGKTARENPTQFRPL